MLSNIRFNKVALAVAMTVGLSTAAVAQETSSTIRGVVTGPQGAAAAGTVVTIVHQPSGTTRTVTVRENGQFSAKGLRVGGPYLIQADSEQFEDAEVTGVFLSLGEAYQQDFALVEDTAVERISVTGARMTSIAFSENGPAATFTREQFDKAPAINRNLADIVRLDPRIYVDESSSGVDAIQCAGKSPRYNSLTIDGVRMNDSFGLNSNGYPTERMPFSYDVIEQVTVELAPFDVQYGGFSACNINAVTKSGTNELFGGFFYDYSSDSLQGDTLEGETVTSPSFTEKRFGFNLGGALLEDELFFFAAYEKLEGANTFERGAAGSGAINELNVSQADLDEIANIAREVYKYDPGMTPSSIPNFDEKLLMKLDWNISDEHRLSYTYNYNDGNNFTESDGDLNEFEFQNHLYERGAELNSHVVTLYSDWSDKFTTEAMVGYLELDNRQISVGGTDFGEMQIRTSPVNPDEGSVTVYIGGDDSRQSNKLKYDNLRLALKGTYYSDLGHTVSFGYERESVDVFNLFIQHSETETRFSSIEDFRNGEASRIYYNNAPSHNPNDAAADWGYQVNTLYVQDEFEPMDDLVVKAGLRYDWYTTSDAPEANPDFTNDYGFSNSTNLDGEGLIQPRVGLTYNLSDDTTLRGGFGLYSGGNPNVWLSNNYSNNNVLQFGQRVNGYSLFADGVEFVALEDNLPAGAGAGYGIPKELYDAVSTGEGSNFEINYLDPEFKLPSEWKVAAGLTHVLENDIVFNADALLSFNQDSPIVLRADLEQTGTNEAGYPTYDSVREPAFKLTNTGEDTFSYILSASLSGSTEAGIDWNVGYNFSDAEDVQPMTSSVAFSNYINRAFVDPQAEVVSTSNYNIKHNLTGYLAYSKAFVADYETTISLFARANSGRPYSINTVEGNDVYNYTPYLEGEIVLPVGASRNSEDGSWWVKADLRVAQELPGLADGHKANAFFVIDNFTNFLNDEWGVLEQSNFPFIGDESRIGEASIWQMRFGVQYSF